MIPRNNPDSMISKANLAFEDACRNAISRAKAANTGIVIWRDGKVVELTPDEAAQELATNLAKRDANQN